MKSLDHFLLTSLHAGSGYLELPPLAAEKGSERLAAAAAQVGESTAKRLAKEAGPYLLEDKLALKLKLQGLRLGAHGEVPALSPPRWVSVEARAVPAEASALLLEADARRRFRAFLRAQGPRAPKELVDLIRLARHFFYDEPVRVAVPKQVARA